MESKYQFESRAHSCKINRSGAVQLQLIILCLHVPPFSSFVVQSHCMRFESGNGCVISGLTPACVLIRKWYTTLSGALKCSSFTERMKSFRFIKPLCMYTRPFRANMYPAPCGFLMNIVLRVFRSGCCTPAGDTHMIHTCVSSL